MEFLKSATPRPQAEVDALRKTVADMIQDVKEQGDQALLNYNTRFDGNTRPHFRVTRAEIDAAYTRLSDQERTDLRQAAANIRAFAQAQRGCLRDLDGFSTVPHSTLGHRVIPVSSCGCYIPGGSYPLFLQCPHADHPGQGGRCTPCRGLFTRRKGDHIHQR